MKSQTKKTKKGKQNEQQRHRKLEKKRLKRQNKKYEPERYLSRNQKEVAKRLIDGEVTMISSASWGFVERFLVFLNTLGFFELIRVDGARFYRQMIDIGLLIMTYEIKVLLGIASMNQVGERLFKDVALMRLIGYTNDQLLSGFCHRGRAESDKPIHKNTLADAVEKLTPEELDLIFNEALKRLAAHGFFERSGGVFALDSTDLPSTECYEGAGRRTKIVKKKTGMVQLSQKVSTPIQQHDSTFTLDLVQQARDNLGNDSIDILIADRGFLDGEDLWTLKHVWGIDFIVPAKTNMRVTAEARSFAQTPADGDSVFVAHRAGDEQQRGEVQLRGMRSLRAYDQYGDAQHQKQIDTRRFKPNPINALLIQSWNGRVPKEETVFLTSLPVVDPLWVLDTYGLRTLIENCLFRELKQGWNLLAFPKKTQDAVRGHVYLTLLVFNLSNAYRTHTGQDLTAQGIRRQRRDWHQANQVFVFAGEYYAIFDLEELLIFLDREPEICWRVDPDRVRREYGFLDQEWVA
jgi:hypothetical protein